MTKTISIYFQDLQPHIQQMIIKATGSEDHGMVSRVLNENPLQSMYTTAVPPESLTINELEESFNYCTFSNLESAQDYIKMNSGTLYTQVDSGSDYPEVLYSRGYRRVNRTGIYAVVLGLKDKK